MSKFVKFLKGILSNKRQKDDFETVALTEKCNALLMADIPPKLQDPGSFSISCKIGPELIQKAFCDLGTSVSLLPYSLLEDVPVEVGGCIIPTDFIVLDMEEDPKIPIILGRSFLTTAGALIYVKNHKLSMEIGKERLEFDLSDSPNCVSSSQGNSSKMNIHKVEECSFQEMSPPTRKEK
ncbi:uncharacterized protein LOC121991140 [Zingiber officinale]|uniref:uncharacterized protein LOC121991140 n=1 Tax=Zingiber officinale TaxID=94328 RepID=UPI001C4BACB7|nr:uncharacterized protein LOC121991140 [Zingiber officinale]